MEILVGPGAMDYDLALWAAVPWATPSVGTPSYGFAVSGTAAPAIQAVLTLNVTSDTNLTYLLAGLLDNNTTLPDGQLGVNGYFVNVTDQLPTLGLNTVVLSTLANSSQPDSGVFGAPCALCIPAVPGAATLERLHLHPHDLFSFFAGLWNSFSGVVAALLTHLATLVHALVGIVWNGLIAAEAFFDHIRQGLAHYALVFVQDAVSDLKTAGKVLLDGLQVLLVFVEREVTTLLSAAFSPIINGINSYVSNVNQAIGTAYGTVSGGSQVSPSEASVVGMALSGSVFEIGLGIGSVMEVALVVLTPVDIGPSFLVTTLIGLVIGSLLKTISTTGMTNQVGSPTELDATFLHSMQNYMNTTTPSHDANYSASTETWIEVLLLLSKLPTIMFAFGFLAASVYADENPVLPAIALGLLFVAIAVTLYLLTHPTPNQVLIDVALTLSTLLFLIGVHTYQAQVGPELKTLAGIDLLVATVVFGFSLYEFLERFK